MADQILSPVPSINPDILRKSGYNDKDIEFINKAHANNYTDEEIDEFLKNEGSSLNINKTIPLQRSTVDSAIDFSRPIASSAGATAVGAISGPAAPVTGPITYAAIDALLQHLQKDPKQSIASEAMGLKKGGVADTLTNTGEQAAIGQILGGIFKGGARVVNGINSSNVPDIYKLGPTTSEAAKSEGQPILSKVTKMIEDIFSTGSKKEAQSESAQLADKEALNMGYRMGHSYVRSELKDPAAMFKAIANDIPEDVTPVKFVQNKNNYTPITFKKPEYGNPNQDSILIPGSPASKSIPGDVSAVAAPTERYATNYGQLDKILEDPDKIQALLTKSQAAGSTNLKADLKSYKFMRMWQNSTTVDPQNPSKILVDAKSLADQLYNPESQDALKTIYSQQNRADIEQFFKNVAITQDKIAAHPVAKMLWLTKDGIALSIGLLNGHIGTAAAADGAAYLGANVVGKLLTSPKTARLLVNLAGGQPLGVSDIYASKVLSSVLQGATVSLANREGQKVPYTVDGEKLVQK